MKLQWPVANRRAGRSSWLPLKALPQVLWQASTEWIDDNVQRLGASVAFYTLLSLAPLVVIAVGVAAVVYGEAAAQGRLAWEIRGLAGSDIARTIQGLVKDAYRPRTGILATLAGLAALIFAASSVFVELHDAMNTIWNVPSPTDRTTAATLLRLVKNRFYSFSLVVGTGFLLLASLLLNAWVAAMKISVPRGATIVLSTLIVTVLFAALYKIVPDVKLRWTDVAPGAAIASLLFVAGKQLMGLYFAHAGFESTYGAAGSPIVLLLWVYYSAQIFFWGAEFIKVYKRTLGAQGR